MLIKTRIDFVHGSPAATFVGTARKPVPQRLRLRLGWSDRLLAATRPLLRRPGFVLALAFVAVILVGAVAPELVTRFDPFMTSPAAKLTSPNTTHWFGTDELGRDLFSRVVHGSALSIRAGLLAVAIAMVGGLGLGVLSGFVGGRTDSVIMRFVDVLLALPGFLLSLAVVTAIGFGTLPVAIAVGIGIVPGFARTTRAEVLRVKTLPYVEAARLVGAKPSTLYPFATAPSRMTERVVVFPAPATPSSPTIFSRLWRI